MKACQKNNNILVTVLKNLELVIHGHKQLSNTPNHH